MEKYHEQIQDTVKLLRNLSKELEEASNGKLSTNDTTPERLLWEIFNKIFNILVILENSLLAKDSLTIHLVARYSYEMLIVFAYIFLDKSETQTRAQEFTQFNQFKDSKRMWTDKTFSQMVEAIPNDSRFKIHKRHYRNLSNFAHPTMDSFQLNRRGDQNEFLMIFGTLLLTVGTILEITKICFEENLHFTETEKKKVNLTNFYTKTNQIMEDLQVK